ncbi:hypothetical protein Bpfe_014529 [Biomphalaria pfeifferi]|uniref:THAP-type domain-containing protein n=1 Tax=Biomphalaria pfeifferi TaxID=112525 RepID=A0AAD8BK84_BIOPF|nr:hypothetical protein Bpfe_014529 [Biomphalaria pfeifferi]
MERGEGWNPDAHDVVDSTHFTAEDFDESRKLKPMAVPTIFDMHENVKPQACNNNGQSYTATCSNHDVVALIENFHCTCYPNQKEAYSTVMNKFPLP